MADKLVGYTVWHGGKWYVRRRYAGAGRKAAVAALARGLILAASR